MFGSSSVRSRSMCPHVCMSRKEWHAVCVARHVYASFVWNLAVYSVEFHAVEFVLFSISVF